MWQKNNSKTFAGRFWTTSSVASCTDSVWGRSTRSATPSLVGLFIHSLSIPHSDWRIFLIFVREKVFWFEQASPLMLSWSTPIINDVKLQVFNLIISDQTGVPSDAFVIDTPGVHIAPYFILCPPPEAVHPLHDTVQVDLWYKSLCNFCPLGKPWILVVYPRPSRIMMIQCFCSSEPKHWAHHGQTFFGKKMRFHQLSLIFQYKNEYIWVRQFSPQFDVQDPIFITEGIEIEEETDGSTLTVHNLQLEDQVFKMDLYFMGF